MNELSKKDQEIWNRVTKTINPLGTKNRQGSKRLLLDVNSINIHHNNMKKTHQTCVDLHGLSLNDAYSLILSKIPQAVSMGYKCILLITGKGIHNTGLLRKYVPMWLSQQPFTNYIKNVTYASRKDGGDGALYIYLKNINI